MNPTQAGGLFRDAVKAIAMLVVGSGLISGGSWVEIAGGAAAFIGAAFWSWHTNKTSTQLAAVATPNAKEDVVQALMDSPTMRDNLVSAVASAPDVKAVVMSTRSAADAIPEENVVGPNASTATL